MTLDYDDLKKIKPKQQLNYILGLDLGIGSVGWAMALIDDEGNPYKIAHMNSLVFSSGVDSKGNSIMATRREARHVHRNKRRKNYRKQKLINYFIKHKLLTSKQIKDTLANTSVNIYELRTKALDNELSMTELFRICYFFYAHRGFRSLRKSESKLSASMLKKLEQLDETGTLTDSNASEDDKLLLGVEVQKKLLAKYRTVGEMLYRDPKFKDGQRNHLGSYMNSVGRKDLLKELSIIFDQQASYSDINADNLAKLSEFVREGVWNQRDFDHGPTVDLKSKGNHYTYKQGDLITRMIGKDPYTQELRAPKGSYSSVLHRLWQSINNLAYTTDVTDQPEKLTLDERKAVYKWVMNGKNGRVHDTVTYEQLAKQVFGVKLKKKEDINDHIWFNLTDDAKSTFFNSNGLSKLQEYVQPEERSNQELLDDLAFILLEHKSDKTRLDALQELLNAHPDYSAKLNDTPEHDGFLSLNMTQTDAFGLKTLQIIDAGLAQDENYDYSTVIKDNFGDKRHRMTMKELDDQLVNPIVKKTFMRASKLVETIIKRYGFPASIHLEFTKDFARSSNSKKAIAKKQKDNKKANDDARKKLAEITGYDKDDIHGFDIIKYKLWKEQGMKDLYDGTSIAKQDIIGSATEVDHIVPYSLSFNDSYNNKVLTHARNNQLKAQHTPLGWLSDAQGKEFEARVLATKEIASNKAKVRNLLKKEEDVDRHAVGWKNSALPNTGYIAQLMTQYLTDNLVKGSTTLLNAPDTTKESDLIVVFNGTTTATWRRRWGLSKVREDGHLHHAVDAVAIAMITRKMADTIAKQAKKHELKELNSNFIPPYKDFLNEVTYLTSDNPKLMFQGHKWDSYTNDDIDKLKPLTVVHKDHRHWRSDMLQSTIYGEATSDDGVILTTHKRLSDLVVVDSKLYGWNVKEKKTVKIVPVVNERLLSDIISAFNTAGEQYVSEHPGVYDAKKNPDALRQLDDNYIYPGWLLFKHGVPVGNNLVKRIKVKKADFKEGMYLETSGGYQQKNTFGQADIYQNNKGKLKLSATYAIDCLKGNFSEWYFNTASDPRHLIEDSDKHVTTMHNGDYLMMTFKADQTWKPETGATLSEVKLPANHPVLVNLKGISITDGRLTVNNPNGGYKPLKPRMTGITNIKRVNINYLGEVE